MRFNVEVMPQGKRTLIMMSGWLDERAELPEFEEPIAGDLVLDLQAVSLLNSMGVRKWMQWLMGLRVERNVILVNCSPVVVKQINILDGFVNDRTRIATIFVPYFCEDCGFEENKLIDIAKMDPPASVAQVVESYTCPKCAKNMELDMVKSQYFTFLTRQKSKFT